MLHSESWESDTAAVYDHDLCAVGEGAQSVDGEEDEEEEEDECDEEDEEEFSSS